MNGKPTDALDSTFEADVIRNELPVLVDFWAVWCGPCRMIAPVVEELASEYAGKFAFRKLNVDENPAVSQQYNVRAIPTLLIFKNGKVVDTIVGAVPKRAIKSKLDAALAAV